MDIGVIAKRYAKALLKYALEEKAEDTVYDEILTFMKSYKEIPQVRQVMMNPLLEAGRKTSLLCAAASVDASPVLRKFMALVVGHHRENILIFIASSFSSMYREHKKISIGRLITAVPAAEAEVNRLEKWVEEQTADCREVMMEKQVNPDILGGFIFEIDDYRIDASVASQFERIKKQFIEKNKRIV